MKHYHFDQIDSTQTHLKNLLLQKGTNENSWLVSCNAQVKGRGRGQRNWEDQPEGLAFSLTLNPTSHMTLIPLEVACLILKFFSHSPLGLKWPNDIIDLKANLKCGGILCDIVKTQVVVGIGLNISTGDHRKNENHPYGLISLKEFNQEEILDDFKKTLPLKIYQFILNNRLNDFELRAFFLKHCVHHKREVVIQEDSEKTQGIFKDIGDYGEAIVENKENQIRSFLNGSLRII